MRLKPVLFAAPALLSFFIAQHHVAPTLIALFTLLSFLAVHFFISKSETRQFNSQAQRIVALINEIKNGDVKARLPEFESSELMSSFNEMAERIEALVEKTRTLESAKSKWLQELAHDLRIPLATLDLSLITLKDSDDKLDSKTKSELLDSALHEINYVKNLVEDLLFIALMEDDNYFSLNEQVPATLIIDDELQQFESKARTQSKKILCELPDVDSTILANKKLFLRLIRNALENSLSYAKSKVEVRLDENEEGLVLSIANDCNAPVSENDIASFGVKRHQRHQEATGQARPQSLGLGSVIIRQIIQKFGGTYRIKNVLRTGLPWVELQLRIPSKTSSGRIKAAA